MYLPNGVTVEEYLKTWHTIDYGSAADKSLESVESAPAPVRKFIPAGKSILKLRNLAQKGRASISQTESEMIKVAWGENIEDIETSDNFGHFIFRESGNNAFTDTLGEIFDNNKESQSETKQ